ncbi:MAG: hypothetical protein MUE98_16605 [Rhodobacteraceae bacterium]|jgi:hypothetical protein|nr:hypothetical protein [Paracoccaceae bacterium]
MRADVWRRLLPAVVICLVASAAAAQESDDRVEFYRELLSGSAQEKAAVRQFLERTAPPPHLRTAFARHFRDLLSSKAVVAALAEDLALSESLLSAGSGDSAGDLLAQFGAAWIQETAIAGVSRLADADRRQFFVFALAIVSRMTTSDCAASIRGHLSAAAMGRAEMAAMAHLPSEKVDAYLDLMRRAIEAEVIGYPSALPLGVTEIALANQAFGEAMGARVGREPDAKALLLAMEDLDASPDEVVCRMGRLSIEAALSVPGRLGDWVIRVLGAS